MNKVQKKYMKDLKLFLPIHGKNEKKLFANIQIRLNDLSENTPSLTYEQICEELGTPAEIVSEYFYNSDVHYLSNKLRISQYIRRFLIILCIAIVIISSVRYYYLQKLYIESSTQNTPTYFIETID